MNIQESSHIKYVGFPNITKIVVYRLSSTELLMREEKFWRKWCRKINNLLVYSL